MSKRVLALLAVVATSLAVLAVGAKPAFADNLVIRKVDTTKFPTVVVSAQLNGAPANLADVHLRENGRFVNDFDAVPLGKSGTPVGVVLLIDTSGSMNQNSKLDNAKAAARQFVLSKQPNDQIALVSVNSQPRVLVNFTSDANLVLAGIDGLVATGETALWDGVRTSVGLFADHPELQPNLVVLTDGQDTVSSTTFDEAKGAAQTAHATVYAVGLEGGDFDGAPLQNLASATEGQYQATADPGTLTTMYRQVQQSLQNQYQITYTSQSAPGPLDLLLTFGNTQANASVSVGGVAQGQTAQPQVVDSSGGTFGFLGGSTGKLLAVLLGLVAAGLLAYGIILIAVRERSTLESALKPYSGSGEADEDVAEFESEHSAFADSAFMQRAVSLTARIAEERGILGRVERMMEEADLPLRAAEALFFYVSSVVVLTLLSAVVSRSIFATIAVLVITGLVPVALLQFLASQRKKKFQAQLPDMLQLMAGSLRAGYSLMQGVEAVAEEVDDPMGRELRRVLAEARLGRVLEDALDDMADRLGSRDFAWAVMAIRIQREVGGNLAELLSTVAETMIARERLRREVRALTAEGRISAIVLGLLPIGLGVVMYSINRDYINVLLHDGFGQTLLIGAALLAGVGFYWMKKTIEIDI
ncbi:MAG: type II secretion system F family protein [Acidimicrobiia bacterium]|nr:type II secretion system F family protein [Acidimicrobiia bacterium]